MAKYLLLIHENETEWDAGSEAEHEAHFAIHMAFQRKNKDAIIDTKALDATTKAKYLRKADREGWTVTDGVFGETKEAIGGYYLVEAADLDAATALAGELPGFGDDAVIEVRTVFAGQ